MTRRETIQEKLRKDAMISCGFITSVSCENGLIMGADGLDFGSQGSPGLLIPWMGSKHIKILVGDPY